MRWVILLRDVSSPIHSGSALNQIYVSFAKEQRLHLQHVACVKPSQASLLCFDRPCTCSRQHTLSAILSVLIKCRIQKKLRRVWWQMSLRSKQMQIEFCWSCFKTLWRQVVFREHKNLQPACICKDPCRELSSSPICTGIQPSSSSSPNASLRRTLISLSPCRALCSWFC